jgi:hypothetical protein
MDQQSSLAGIPTLRLDPWSSQRSDYASIRSRMVPSLDHGSTRAVSRAGKKDWHSEMSGPGRITERPVQVVRRMTTRGVPLDAFDVVSAAILNPARSNMPVVPV